MLMTSALWFPEIPHCVIIHMFVFVCVFPLWCHYCLSLSLSGESMFTLHGFLWRHNHSNRQTRRACLNVTFKRTLLSVFTCQSGDKPN